jgi:hypothetical protein
MDKEPYISTKDKIIQSQDAFRSFFSQLEGPNDIYKQIVLEEFFKFILGNNDLSLFSEFEQEGHDFSSDISGGLSTKEDQKLNES